MKFSLLKKNLNMFIYFFWFICIIYLFYQIIKNFNQFSVEISRIEFDQLFFIFIFSFILINVYSFRFFFFLKKLNKYSRNFIEWSQLFFKTSLMNLFLQGSGLLLGAIELKKKNVSYTTFININFFIYILHFFFVMLFLFLILSFLIKEENIFLYFFILILFLFILLRKRFILFLINFIKKNFSFYKKQFTSILKNFSFNYDIFFLTKNILIFFLFSLVIFLLEFFIYYIIAKNILPSSNFFQIMLIFLFILLLNYIPILKNLVGINELFVGMLVESFDFYFLSGAVIQLILRLTGNISVIVMSLFYHFLSINRKNLK
jgi:hypothetical protein